MIGMAVLEVAYWTFEPAVMEFDAAGSDIGLVAVGSGLTAVVDAVAVLVQNPDS